MRTKTELRRNAIKETAITVFLELGYDRTTMADIASRLGSSKATLYRYFPSKEDLFLEVMQALGEVNFSGTFADLLPGKDLRATLLRFGGAILEVMLSPDGLAMYRLMAAGSADPEVGRRMFAQGPAKADGMMRNLLQVAMDTGQLRQADAMVACHHLRGLLEAECFDARLFGVLPPMKPTEINAVAQRAIDAFLAAYGVEANNTKQ